MNTLNYHSKFGGLWTDLIDANSILEKKYSPSTLRSRLEAFINHGYVIIPGAVSPELIDRYLEAFDTAIISNTNLLASVPTHGPHDKSIIQATAADRLAPLTKYLDTYWFIKESHEIIFNELTVEFLNAIFECSPLAFQGLHFETGSTQRIHQDTAYVVSEKPLSLAASWLALEDVQEGSGELEYFEGSHRLPDWIYSNNFKHYNPDRDSQDQHLAHLDFIENESTKRGFPLKKFLPKKGDVLIWAADLAHGGSSITKPGVTRRSLVTHFTQSTISPNYFKNLPIERRVTKDSINNRGKFSTLYY